MSLSDDELSVRCDELSAAVRRLLDRADPLHERLVRQSPYFHADTLEAGLSLSLGGWTSGERLYRHVRAQVHASAVPPQRAVVVLGGVLPPSHVQAIAYPFCLGADVLIKPPSADPLFPALFAEALGRHVQLIGGADVPAAVRAADAVVVVGSDEAVRGVSALTPVGTPWLGFGARTAVSIVGGQLGADDARRLAIDVTTFDQRGCLSPTEVLVVVGESSRVASSLADAMRALPPRRRTGIDEDALTRARELAWLRGDTVFGPESGGPERGEWAVIAAHGGQFTGTAGGRHVIVRAVDEVSAALAPLRGRLSAVSTNVAVDVPALARLGAARVVPLGSLQAAPPEWPHDGRLPFTALCRYVGRD